MRFVSRNGFVSSIVFSLLLSVAFLACASDAADRPDGTGGAGPGGNGGTGAGDAGGTNEGGTGGVGGSGGGEAVCGNGVVEAGEACDQGELNSDVEPDRCREDCTLPRCGDGVIDGGEDCSPGDTAECSAIGKGEEGIAVCTDGCTWDLADCWTKSDCLRGGVPNCDDPRCAEDKDLCPVCGDGSITGDEVCDGDDLGGWTCRDHGFASGTLVCAPDCSAFETTACSRCGDGVIDDGEECDLTNLAGNSCLSLGYVGGMLSCTPECTIDTSGCQESRCGDGFRGLAEVCDGEDLGGETCQSQGFTSGILRCDPSCASFDTSLCSAGPAVCGNGVREGDESCDDSNQTAGDGCSATCELEDGGVCGPMIDLNAVANPTANGFTYTGSNRNLGDDGHPSCRASTASDVALAYWVESDSTITLVVAQDPAATHQAKYVLHVRTNCADPQSEIACHDGMDGQGLQFSTVQLQNVAAGTQLYIFVDTAIGAAVPLNSGGGFILQAQIFPNP